MARRQIDSHALAVLEFDAVRQMLASYASSDLGRDAAMVLYPSADAAWIASRLAETTELRALLDEQVRVPLAGLRDIGPLIEGFGKREAMFDAAELLAIRDTLSASGRLRAFFAELDARKFVALQELGARLCDFGDLVGEIDRCIAGDKTVRDQASEALGKLRQQIANLGAKIQRQFTRIVSSPQVRKGLENDKFLMRHGRPVVAIRVSHRHVLHGTVLDRSNSGATLYIEPDELVELSNELEDLLYEEKKEVSRILWQLTKAVLGRRKDILQSVKVLGFVDLTYAKARFSIAYRMTCPDVSAESFLRLRQARHPLLLGWTCEQQNCDIEQAEAVVVPVDVRLGDDFDLLLVTGPNTGGKTVLLKTIGLLTLMAQGGMHVTARSDSKIPVYSQVHADIGDEQSIQQSLSTFSAHMQQIVRILNRTNKKTLVLLDELGAGTDPAEGAVLATAILDKLLAKQTQAVATTHLGQLKTYAYATDRAENASVEFDSETLEPTYKLLIGTPGSSNAMSIAKRLGMPKAVVDRAQSLLSAETDGTTELINQVQKIRQTAEQRRSEADQVLDEAKSLRKRASARLKKVRQVEKRLRQDADREIDQSMRQVRSALEDFTAQMQNAPKPWSEHVERFAETVSDVAAETPLAVRHAKFVEGLRRGDSVYVIRFRAEAVVDRIHRKRKTVVVLMGGKQIQVPFEEVCKPDPRLGGGP